MTTPDAHTVISVRGESQRIVAPDQASIYVTLLARGDTKRAASSEVTRALGVVTAELAELGGEGLTALTTRAPLTWSIQSIQTFEDGSFDQTTGAKRPTGRHQASATLLINVRDFEQLGRVEGIVTGHDVVNIGSVHWSVDEDNPARPQVRADAIRTALHKGQDYASALGGSIVSSSTSPMLASSEATRGMTWLTGKAETCPWGIWEGRTARRCTPCHKQSAQQSRHV